MGTKKKLRRLALLCRTPVRAVPVDKPEARCKDGRMSTSRRAVLGVAGLTAVITALHGYLNVNWKSLRNSFRSRDRMSTLIVGGLPVTCNLTLPIACVARDLDTSSTRANFEFKRYNGWPEVKESMISGEIDAA